MNSAGDTSCDEALRNPLILHEVFQNLPTKFLLSSISLVNKNWNREARIYIRDSRMCRGQCPFNMVQACEFLAAFSQLCQEVTTAGRVIPWNCLMIFLAPCQVVSSSEEIFQGVLQSELRLKHVDIYWGRHDGDCTFHKPLFHLLRHKSTDIQRLKFQSFGLLLRETFFTETLQFSRLEEISLRRESPDYEDWSDEKAMITRIFETAPKLKKIVCDDSQSLQLIPEEYYGLLDTFHVCLRNIEYASLYAKILQGATRLREIIYIKPSRPYYEPEDDQLTEATDTTLELLLQSRGQGLTKIWLEDLYPLGLLRFPPLLNLTKLVLSSRYVNNVEEFWDGLNSLNLTQNMPGLKEVYMGMTINSYTIWPANGSLPFRLLSKSVRELTLWFHVGKINMLHIKCAFPQISVLNLRVSHAEPVPFCEIWELWPHLEQVKVNGWYNLLKRNYDSDFCGVFPEEVAELEKEDDDYLKAVRIVPVRPSLLTMPNLRKLRIDLPFGKTSFNQQGHPHVFISKVTQHVVLSKLTAMDISVTWTCGSSVRDDEHHEQETR